MGNKRTLRKENATIPTPDGVNSIITLAGGDKTLHGNSTITLNRDNSAHSTLVENKLSLHEPRNKMLMSLTPNEGDNMRLETFTSDKRACEENLKNTEVKSSPLNYTNRTSITAVTGRAAYSVRISTSSENNIMQAVICLFDTEAQQNLISKRFLPTDLSSKISNEGQPPVLSVLKERIRTKCNTTQYTRARSLLTSILLTVSEKRANDVLLGTIIVKHILAALLDERKVDV